LFFFCCGSVAAPRQLPGHYDQESEKNVERRHGHRPRRHDQAPATHNRRHHGRLFGHNAYLSARRRGQRPGAMAKYL
jgi:hypothetical protein